MLKRNKLLVMFERCKTLRVKITSFKYIFILVAVLVSRYHNNKSIINSIRWTLSQWIPIRSIQTALLHTSWNNWDSIYNQTNNVTAKKHTVLHEEIPIVDVQEHLNDLSSYLESKYGIDWKRRPLLLRNLWSQSDLSNSTSRRLSLEGLLKENLTVPYFWDSSKEGALTPDRSAPINEIISNMNRGAPHKIGTQLLIQHYPEIILEVAPTKIVTDLFGSYFTPNSVKGFGPYQIFPALTTVPIFVANGTTSFIKKKQTTTNISTKDKSLLNRPFTALHCEPIGNIAVQLSGKKQWTLIRPEFSNHVKPSLSPDGRAFFASWQSSKGLLDNQVPSYTAITVAGDAMWVPPWTWHRVDYIESNELSIGASLFHFRFFEFVQNNPLFAFLIIPAMILEVVGYKTQ